MARFVAESLERDDPKHIISRMARMERAGKVFIDWSQNAEHKTTVAVYSVRAKRAEPFASMPLAWEEVETALRKGVSETLAFRPDAAIQRVDIRGDLFSEVLSLEQQVPDALLQQLGIRAPVTVSAARVPTTNKVRPSLPRSSGQGGRKLFVVHLVGKTYRLGIERNGAFELFDTTMIPLTAKSSSKARESGRTGIAYLTAESDNAGVVWDLGTFEVVEGGLETGNLALYFSGRKLEGEWLLKRTGQFWTLTNVAGTLNRTIPVNSSALLGIPGVPRKGGRSAAA